MFYGTIYIRALNNTVKNIKMRDILLAETFKPEDFENAISSAKTRAGQAIAKSPYVQGLENIIKQMGTNPNSVTPQTIRQAVNPVAVAQGPSDDDTSASDLFATGPTPAPGDDPGVASLAQAYQGATEPDMPGVTTYQAPSATLPIPSGPPTGNMSSPGAIAAQQYLNQPTIAQPGIGQRVKNQAQQAWQGIKQVPGDIGRFVRGPTSMSAPAGNGKLSTVCPSAPSIP